MPQWNLGVGYNWISHLITEQLMWQTLRGSVNNWRKESLKLPPVPFLGPFNTLYQDKAPFIYAYSQHVVTRTQDMPDWHHTTGYWFLESQGEWAPPQNLLDFLSRGPKHIYIGFGSMSGQTARRLASLAVEAVTLSGQRAVLLGGWAGAHDLKFPEHIYACAFAPHDWLFPRMAAVVHHGGAGTTAAGLKAGKPTVITPFMGDQPFWGKQVYDLSVGPRPILGKRLTVNRLADAITHAVTEQTIITRAAELGKKIRSENGVARAVEIIHQYLS